MYSVLRNLSFARLMPLSVAVLLGVSAFVAPSCNSEARRQKAACDSLVQAASDMVDQGRYTEAFALMDSVDTRFPKLLEQRREVTRMRSSAMEAYSQQQLVITDSLIADLEARLVPLSPRMDHVEGDDIAGYFVAKSAHKPGFMSSTGVQGRVDDEDLSFYLVAVNSGKPIGVNQLCFHRLAGDMLSPAIDPASERSGDSEANGIDLATFVPAEVDAAIEAMASDPASVSGVTLMGKNGGSVLVRLSPDEVQAIVDAWRFADCTSRLQRARWLHDKLEQQLLVARDHSANLAE